ncbi:MAG: hypothetical protein BGP06_18935 [Rhizobiales bacterium 65-9]|nr:porin family protein [Hyphomicrobiales bacterium]OJY35057.1 MAG: hypothetical protein BGP06_18935 [Rhizobiales bacterium 65-9]
MKKIFLASAALAALTTASLAADLPSSKGPPIAPMYVPAFSWTGFYVGLQGGYAWGRSSGTISSPIGVPALGYAYDAKGGLFGGHVGYNYQFSPNFVAGLEGDLEWAGIKDSVSSAVLGVTHRTKLDWQGSVRARFGVAFDRVLVYATGGVAFADIKRNVYTFPGGVNLLSNSNTRAGWTLGGGIEYAVTNNVSIRGEYRYTSYNNKSSSNPVLNIADDGKYRQHAVRAGITYKF